MNVYEIQMLSTSSDAIYTVTCRHTDGVVNTLVCNCPAGQFGDLCKHLSSIFAHDTRFLSPDKPEYTTAFQFICNGLASSAVSVAYDQMIEDLAAIEVNQKALKQAAKNIKLTFVRSLNTP